MKSNLFAILLLLACVSLGVVLWKQNQTYRDQTRQQDQTINLYSNRVAILQDDLAHEAAANAALSNRLGVVETTLSTTSARLQKAEAEAETAAAVAVSREVAVNRIMEVRKIDSDQDSRDLREIYSRLLAQYAELYRSQK